VLKSAWAIFEAKKWRASAHRCVRLSGC